MTGGSYIKTFLSEAGPGRTLEYKSRRQILFQQGKRGNAVFYILAGTVALSVVKGGGKERIISLHGPGGFAGKECLATVRPRNPASAMALTDCTVLRIERNELLRVIKSEPNFASMFRDYLLESITRYQCAVMDHLFDSSEKRLARTLLLLANLGVAGKAETVVPNIGQILLAEVVGTTRSRISHFLNHFRSLGIIDYKTRGPFTVRTAKLSQWLLQQS